MNFQKSALHHNKALFTNLRFIADCRLVVDDVMIGLDRFHHQSLVEVRVLDALRKFDVDGRFNVVHMTDYFLFRSHLCIVFELMG